MGTWVWWDALQSLELVGSLEWWIYLTGCRWAAGGESATFRGNFSLFRSHGSCFVAIVTAFIEPLLVKSPNQTAAATQNFCAFMNLAMRTLCP